MPVDQATYEMPSGPYHTGPTGELSIGFRRRPSLSAGRRRLPDLDTFVDVSHHLHGRGGGAVENRLFPNAARRGGTAGRAPRPSPGRHPRDLFLGSPPAQRLRRSSTSSAARRRLLFLDHTAGKTTPNITSIAKIPGKPMRIIASCASLAKTVAVAPPATAAFETTLAHRLTAQAGRDCNCVHDHFLLPGSAAPGTGFQVVYAP